MVLPLLGGIAGSALAGAGMLGGLSPLLASALGSGIGTFAQTGEIDQALTSGLTAGLTGGMLGGSFATGASGLAGGMGAAPAVANAGASGIQQVASNILSQAPNAGAGIGGLMSQIGGPQGGVGAGISGLVGAPAIKGYVGALGAQAAMPMGMDQPQSERNERSASMAREGGQAPGRSLRTPTRYGGPEFDYRVKPNYGVRRMTEGGIAALGGDMDTSQIGGRNAKQVVSDAIGAIEGTNPNPELALGAFLAMFGEDKLRALIKDVRSGQAAQRRNQDAGLVRGPEGAGDLIPASIEGQQDVLMEDGEFVVTRDAIDNLGGGDNQRGGERMMEMMRAMEQAGPMDDEAAKRVMAS